MTLILFFAIPLTFPHDSREAAHYLTPMAIGECFYEVSDIAFDLCKVKDDAFSRSIKCSLVGCIGTHCVIYLFFRKHYYTDREMLLYANGICHWAMIKCGVGLLRWKLK